MMYNSYLTISKVMVFKVWGEDEPIVLYRYSRNGNTRYGWGYYFHSNPGQFTSGIRFSSTDGYIDGGDSNITAEDIKIHEDYFKLHGRQIYSGTSMAEALRYLHKYY